MIIPIRALVQHLEGSAANTDTCWQWRAASVLRDHPNWEAGHIDLPTPDGARVERQHAPTGKAWNEPGCDCGIMTADDVPSVTVPRTRHEASVLLAAAEGFMRSFDGEVSNGREQDEESCLSSAPYPVHLQGCQHDKAWLALKKALGGIGVPTLMELVEQAIDRLGSAPVVQEQGETPTTVIRYVEMLQASLEGAIALFRDIGMDSAASELADVLAGATPNAEGFAERATPWVKRDAQKLWLWRNHVDGRPEYWAFDNLYPIHMDNDDPQTLGEPCGYALVKPSRNGRPDVPEAEVLARIAGEQPKRRLHQDEHLDRAEIVTGRRRDGSSIFDDPHNVPADETEGEEALRKARLRHARD